MLILGIETSCDECSIAIVEDGKRILANIIASQVEEHKLYSGVVPEIASRLHTEWITSILREALEEAKITLQEIDAIAVTSKPGLVGALLVGLSFAKGLAYALQKPLITVDHILAHLYAPHLEFDITYPYLGLLVSGGHTLIAQINNYNNVEVLGSTIDDACGEAFDKVAKHYGLEYPGGVAIDRLSKEGDNSAFLFLHPQLGKEHRPLDFSYSGLKSAVIIQKDRFLVEGKEDSLPNIVASFQKVAITILTKRLRKAIELTGLKKVVIGGGVASNSYLREQLKSFSDITVYMPSLRLCTDNGAMIAGIGYCHALDKDFSTLDVSAYSRSAEFWGRDKKQKKDSQASSES